MGLINNPGVGPNNLGMGAGPGGRQVMQIGPLDSGTSGGPVQIQGSLTEYNMTNDAGGMAPVMVGGGGPMYSTSTAVPNRPAGVQGISAASSASQLKAATDTDTNSSILQEQMALILHAQKCHHSAPHAGKSEQVIPPSPEPLTMQDPRMQNILNLPGNVGNNFDPASSRTSNLTHCQTMKDVLSHMRKDQAGNTWFVPLCASSRQIVSHWYNCARHECPVCEPLHNMAANASAAALGMPGHQQQQQKMQPGLQRPQQSQQQASQLQGGVQPNVTVSVSVCSMQNSNSTAINSSINSSQQSIISLPGGSNINTQAPMANCVMTGGGNMPNAAAAAAAAAAKRAGLKRSFDGEPINSSNQPDMLDPDGLLMTLTSAQQGVGVAGRPGPPMQQRSDVPSQQMQVGCNPSGSTMISSGSRALGPQLIHSLRPDRCQTRPAGHQPNLMSPNATPNIVVGAPKLPNVSSSMGAMTTSMAESCLNLPNHPGQLPGSIVVKARQSESTKEWHHSITNELRNHFVQKLFASLIITNANYARKVESDMFNAASSRHEYYHLLAENISKIQKELEEKRMQCCQFPREGQPAVDGTAAPPPQSMIGPVNAVAVGPHPGGPLPASSGLSSLGHPAISQQPQQQCVRPMGSVIVKPMNAVGATGSGGLIRGAAPPIMVSSSPLQQQQAYNSSSITETSPANLPSSLQCNTNLSLNVASSVHSSPVNIPPCLLIASSCKSSFPGGVSTMAPSVSNSIRPQLVPPPYTSTAMIAVSNIPFSAPLKVACSGGDISNTSLSHISQAPNTVASSSPAVTYSSNLCLQSSLLCTTTMTSSSSVLAATSGSATLLDDKTEGMNFIKQEPMDMDVKKEPSSLEGADVKVKMEIKTEVKDEPSSSESDFNSKNVYGL
ncbi:histone lysine acetyltransferase CREBBP isoform X2 [Hyalella azteca]|nr:histone lysine acetyltransferase CREBBP isoform X2 [Hyalella azteca]